jgi:hypothetical protein
VIAWGGEPSVQPFLPLNALRRDAFKVAYDWDGPRLRAMQRFDNRHLWRAIPLRASRQPRRAAPLFAQL